jgi:hypothetical protein
VAPGTLDPTVTGSHHEDVARYDVTVRLRTGWPVSASGLIHLRKVGRSLPGRSRLRRILIHTEGFTELTLRMT